jgi:hypothetical protein
VFSKERIDLFCCSLKLNEQTIVEHFVNNSRENFISFEFIRKFW